MQRVPALIARELLQRPRIRRLAPILADLAAPAATLLDIGAGDGALGREVAARLGAAYHGVDLAPPSGGGVAREDGVRLSLDTGSSDVVLLSDVLHHARDPLGVLREALRVARRAVVVKEHFAFGRATRAILRSLDAIGNRPHGMHEEGTYFTPAAWLELVARAGAVNDALVWPLDVHAAFIRAITRSELQFAARLVPLGAGAR